MPESVLGSVSSGVLGGRRRWACYVVICDVAALVLQFRCSFGMAELFIRLSDPLFFHFLQAEVAGIVRISQQD